MKNKFVLKTLFIATLFGSAAMLSFYTPHVSASTSRLYLSPASGKYKSGQSFTVNIRVSAGQSVNAVQANLSYSATKLSVSSVSYSGSAFEIQAESSASGGSIRMGRGTTSAFTGDRLVGSVTFKAKTGSGSTSVSFAGGTTLANNGSSVTSSTSGGSYSFYTPTTTSSGSSTTKSSTKSKASSTTSTSSDPETKKAAPKKTAADNAGPSIDGITVKNSGPVASMLSFSTNEKATTAIEYGLSSKYGITQSAGSKTTNHSFRFSAKYLLPKTAYHYRIVATDSHGNKTVGADQTFTTSGLPFTMTVLDKDGRPLRNVAVTIDGEKKQTDKDGKAEFSLSLGDKTAAIEYGGKTTLQSFAMDSQALNGKLVSSSVKLDAETASKLLPTLLVLGVLVAVVGLGSHWRARWLPRLRSVVHRQASPDNSEGAPTPVATSAAVSNPAPAEEKTLPSPTAPETAPLPAPESPTTAPAAVPSAEVAASVHPVATTEAANSSPGVSPVTAYAGGHAPGDTVKPS